MNPPQLDRFAALVDLVKRTREAQRAYFQSRDSAALTEARRLERELDKAIDELTTDQPSLF